MAECNDGLICPYCGECVPDDMLDTTDYGTIDCPRCGLDYNYYYDNYMWHTEIS